MFRKKIYFSIFAIMILFLFTSCESTETNNIINNNAEYLDVHFIDVGQADSTLIQSSSGNILIDGGENKTQDDLIEYLNNVGITSFDYVVATHPHSDHIGGLDKVIDSFDIKNIIMPKATHTTKTYENLLKSIKNKNLKPMIPNPSDEISLGKIKLQILAPIKDKTYDNLNNYSIVIKMDYGTTSFLFSGDAESSSEKEIVSNGFNLKSQVYKVGHHGSNTSSSDEFLEAISPEIAVVSCGKDNDYGHPHKEIKEKLSKNNIKTYRTDELGTIIISSDGKNLSLKDKNGIISLETENNLDNQNTTKEFVDSDGNGSIKGNINSNGDKIYHLPGGSYYEQTNPEALFKTEDEAVQNGFRKSSR